MNLPGIGYSARLKYLLLCESSVLMYDNQMDEFWYHLLEVSFFKYRPSEDRKQIPVRAGFAGVY